MKAVTVVFVSLALVATLLVFAFCARGQKAAPLNFAVVELFTSEGCSSCPPADAVFEQLQQQYQGQPVYFLAYHVHYWDHQGWKDRFSDTAYIKRQQWYADRFGINSIYTPQTIVNGRAEYVGSKGNAIAAAVANAISGKDSTHLVLSGDATGNAIHVEFMYSGSTRQSELVLALVQKKGQSEVKAGENEGRHLLHVQLVRELVHVNLNQQKPVSISIPAGLTAQDVEVIGFVQQTRSGHITAAARLKEPIAGFSH